LLDVTGSQKGQGKAKKQATDGRAEKKKAAEPRKGLPAHKAPERAIIKRGKRGLVGGEGRIRGGIAFEQRGGIDTECGRTDSKKPKLTPEGKRRTDDPKDDRFPKKKCQTTSRRSLDQELERGRDNRRRKPWGRAPASKGPEKTGKSHAQVPQKNSWEHKKEEKK